MEVTARLPSSWSQGLFLLGFKCKRHYSYDDEDHVDDNGTPVASLTHCRVTILQLSDFCSDLSPHDVPVHVAVTNSSARILKLEDWPGSSFLQEKYHAPPWLMVPSPVSAKTN